MIAVYFAAVVKSNIDEWKWQEIVGFSNIEITQSNISIYDALEVKKNRR